MAQRETPVAKVRILCSQHQSVTDSGELLNAMLSAAHRRHSVGRAAPEKRASQRGLLP